MIHVLIIEDQRLMRETMETYIHQTEGFHLSGSFAAAGYAEKLHVTTDCVKKHISSMLSKTGYPSKTKLIAMVVSKRLIVNGF